MTKRLLLQLTACLLALSAQIAVANTIDVLEAEVLEGADHAVLFDGSFKIAPGQEVMDVLRRGISLNFVLEVQVKKNRWYWFDKTVGSKKESIRLAYNPLTRQYRISIGSITQNFETIEDALRLMSVYKNWKVCEEEDLNPDDFSARARFFLDTERLPKPLQVSLKKHSGWNLDTGWFEIPIAVSAGDKRP
jgi:hypothetical protein